MEQYFYQLLETVRCGGFQDDADCRFYEIEATTKYIINHETIEILYFR
jgi:hypothetical protein